MTDFPFRPTRVLLALVLLLVAAVSSAADDTSSQNNTFDTPGYPGTSSQRSGNPSLQGSGSGDTSATRQNGSGPNATRTPSNAGNAPQDRATLREKAPPPKPGEFQKFVEAATGRLLPVFGSSFFANEMTDTSMAVDNVPVSADYTIGPGDEILLRAWGSIDVDYRSTVDRNGLLNLPKIGSFNVSGVKASELAKYLRTQIGRLYTNFDLSASLGQLRGLKVFVVGPAQHPGVFTLPSQSTMLSALAAAGGPGPTGSMRRVLLRRDGNVVSELDVYDFLVQGEKSKDIQLAAGDVVVLQPAGARVALAGALDTPAIYELKGAQESVRDVLRYAGGTPTLANPNLAQLERIDPSQPRAARFVEKFKLDDVGLQKPLRDGDILTLLEISPQFANAVTLRGHVAQPLRYPYQPGMRVRDLIPDADALITPDFYRRKNLLVQVIAPDERSRAERRTYSNSNSNSNSNSSSNAYSNANANSNARGSNADDTFRARDSSRSGNGTPDDDLNSTARDDRYGASSRGDSSDARNGAELSGRDAASRRRDEALQSEPVKRAPAPLFDELNWDYAVIERLNPRDLTTQVIPFNLGKAVLQKDEANNLELLPGDVITIFGQRDLRVPVSRQTRLISLEGEVLAPGVYQLQPGDTLKSVLARAGGFTPQAYLYGLEFAREETRRRQRENLNTAIARLESLAAVASARDAANRRDDAVAAASTTAVSNAATQAQLARLRSVEPNGRIALELDPGTTTLEALPDVPLEAGDHIVVPARPGFVTVAGAVVNSNAYLWRPGRTAGEYLRLAGVDEAADASNAFILRANGTVVHAGDTRSFFGRDTLESQVMQAGDALFVPNQLDFETWGRAFVRNLKDFAQIFSGFGLGLAAIHTL